MAERTISWPSREEASLLGDEIDRIDGIEKASGRAKYTADTNPKGTLYARILTCKHGHAKVSQLDVEPARKIKGVHAVHIFRDVGSEIMYDGTPIVAVAAERDQIAQDAIREIKVNYEVLDHYVDDKDLEAAEEAGRTKPPRENTKGDVEQALKNAKAVHKGNYGIQVISHMCLEPHGSHCEFKGDDELTVHLSTQNVSGTAGQFAGPLGLDQSKVGIICHYIGGGFGSKFQADEWGLACAQMAKESGRPVRLMLDRATELKIAGTRPSGFGEITIAADAEGNIVAWDSHHWGTNGMKGGTIDVNQFPYVFDFDNRNRKETGIMTNMGDTRAWRAPNHPQLCALTCAAIDDLAAKLGMDSLDVFMKNLGKTPKEDVYRDQLQIGAKLIGWKEKWHPHGKGEKNGSVRRGLGLALHQWGGRAGAGRCQLKISPDGSVESSMGSQDLGTGTRTVIAMVVAETFGLPVSAVKVNIGENKYPQAGPSGGSTTVGGVSGPNRRAALLALTKEYETNPERRKELPDGIFDLVARKYDVELGSLTARDGKIWSGDKQVCTWKQAAALTGPMGLEVMGEGPKDDGLTDSGVAGIQMADVSVDTETGLIRVNKFVAVQDCGLIIDEKTARSQVLGAMIMGIAYALTEEQIMDQKTGRYINADLENYKLPRIGDIGDLVVEMYQPESERDRGVIGLGEPPVISPGAALSNAVANAIGVRVPVLPMTPKRVLDALKGAQS